MGEYLSRFLKLKCCGDVLNVVVPIASGAEKEISEAFAIVQKVKPIVLKEKHKYKILDLCAGNPLGSILSSFLLPVKETIAIDKRKIDRRYHLVKRFKYLEQDIFDDKIFELIDEDTIIMAIHPCRELSKRIIEIYNQSKAKYLFLMPCCEGTIRLQNKYFLKEKLGGYLAWVYYLSTLCNCKIITDKKCLSEKNAIIIGTKNGK